MNDPIRKEWLFNGTVTDDGRYLVINISEGTDAKNRVYYKDRQAPDAPVVKLLDGFDAAYNFIDNEGSIFWFQTDLKCAARQDCCLSTFVTRNLRIGKCSCPKSPETLQSVSFVNNMPRCRIS